MMPYEHLVAVNATLPISRVMSIPELFSEIMHIALDISPPCLWTRTTVFLLRKKQNDPMTSPQLLSSIVAQMLGAAVVASHIGRIPLAATVFLARARYATLDVYWPAKYPGSMHPARIRSLEGSAASSLPTLLSGTLVNLISLDIDDLQSESGEPLVCPGTIDAPRLAHLNLTNVWLDRSFPHLNAPALRTLDLYGCKCDLECILSVLRATALLEKLEVHELDIDVDRAHDQHLLRTQPFELPRLRTVKLRDGSGWAVGWFSALLAHLRTIPEILEVDINENEEWTEEFLSHCLRTTIRPDSPYCLVLYGETIELHHDTRMNILSSSYPSLDNKNKRADLDYLWHWEMLPCLQMPAEFSNITSLLMHIGNDEWYPSDTSMRLLLCALPNVEVYWAVDDTFLSTCVPEAPEYDGLVRGLAPGPVQHDIDHRHLPLPHLRTLGFGADVEEPSRLLDMMSEVLTARADARMSALEVLSFPLLPQQGCFASARLLSLVSEVHWMESTGSPEASVSTA